MFFVFTKQVRSPFIKLNDAGDQCVDIDECFSEDENRMICLAGECINTIGSYRCKCPPNFSLTANGMGCVDARKMSNDCRVQFV